MRRRIIASILSVLLILSLSGCNVSEIDLVEAEEKTELYFSWWGTDARHDYTMEAIKIFEEKYQNINVHMEYTEWTGYDKKNAVNMAANNEADVMQINFGWLVKYSPDGTRYYDLEKVQSLDLTSFSSDILEFGRSNGVLNALPIALNSKVFLYNKDLYDSYGLSIPTTWDDLFTAANKMKSSGVYPMDLDSVSSFMASVGYVEQSTGKSFFDDNNKLNFNEEDVYSMIEFYLSLVENKVVEYLGDRDSSSYEEGTYAGTVQWITSSENFSETQNTVVGEVPMLPGATNTGWYAKPASMYTISANTQHPEEAALLLDFLVNSSEMAELQVMEKGVPVGSSAKEALGAAGLLNGIQIEAQEVVDNTDTKIMSPFYENSGLQTAFKNALDSILFNNGDIEEEAKIAYDAMKEAI